MISGYRSLAGLSSMQGSPFAEEEATAAQPQEDTGVNVRQAKEILENVMKTDIVPFLWGPPGIGKSSIVKQLAVELDWDLIDLRLSLLNPVDLRGLPVVDKDQKTAEWYKPGFLPNETDKRPGILFLDEINLAPISVQSAAYQLILDKRLGEYVFPKHWKIVAAGNREGVDRANVNKISAPLANRFIHLNIMEDWKLWREWAKSVQIREEIIQFIASHPGVFLRLPTGTQKAFPSPRSWHFVSDLMNSFGYKNGQPVGEMLSNVIIGAVGMGVGKEFLQFLPEYDLKSIDKMIEEFYETGKIDMPDAVNKRMAIIKRVFQDYWRRDIDEATYQKLIPKLNAEEKATLQASEKNAKEKLRGLI